MILTDTTRYIFPPRSQDAIPFKDTTLFATLGWIAQLKYNDSRCLIKYTPDKIELWNRHGERFRDYTAPDWLIEQLDNLREPLGITSTTILDGGILDKKHKKIKDTIVIWDILVHNDDHRIGTTYQSRYDFLAGNLNPTEPYIYTDTTGDWTIGKKIDDNILIPENLQSSTWSQAWDNISIINSPYTSGTPGTKSYSCHPVIEGLVFKDLRGTLEHGWKMKNNSSWMCRSRVETGRHKF